MINAVCSGGARNYLHGTDITLFRSPAMGQSTGFIRTRQINSRSGRTDSVIDKAVSRRSREDLPVSLSFHMSLCLFVFMDLVKNVMERSLCPNDCESHVPVANPNNGSDFLLHRHQIHVPYKPEYKAIPYFSNEKEKNFFQQNLIFHIVPRDVSKKTSKTILLRNNTFSR
jgi:hypothetical protein